LLETVLRPPPAMTRLPTYSWTGHGAVLPEIDGSNNPVTVGLSNFSQGMWNLKDDGWVSPPTTFTNRLRYTCQHPAPTKTILQIFPDETPICQEPLATVQNWALMRAFYSGIHLWPTDAQKSKIGMEGGSPLIWTVLRPPAAFEWLQTYAWAGHLDNYMPWSPDQTSSVEQPPIVSYAHWNIRESCFPMVREKTAQDSTHTHQVTLVPSLATPLLDLLQHGMCKTCHPPARAPPTQQPVLDHESNGWLSKKPLGSFTEAPNPFPPA